MSDERLRKGEVRVSPPLDGTGWRITFGSVAGIDALCRFLGKPESDSLKTGWTEEAAKIVVQGALAVLEDDQVQVNNYRKLLVYYAPSLRIDPTETESFVPTEI